MFVYPVYFIVDQKQVTEEPALLFKCHTKHTDITDLMINTVLICHEKTRSLFTLKSIRDTMYRKQGYKGTSTERNKAREELRCSVTDWLKLFNTNYLVLSSKNFDYLHEVLKYVNFSRNTDICCLVSYHIHAPILYKQLDSKFISQIDLFKLNLKKKKNRNLK